jgi:hypothetical protein
MLGFALIVLAASLAGLGLLALVAVAISRSPTGKP